MLNITILAIGKIKERHFQDACQEYLKRLKPYAKISIEELKAEPFGAGDKERAKKTEAGRILKALEKHEGSEIIILDERGENPTSHGLAGRLDEARHFVFVIGGTLGYDKSILEKSWKKISLSKMTFPHELVRVMLLEQIYRAATIVKGKEYHY